MSEILIGRNPVTEAIQSERSINKVLVAKGSKEGSIKKIIKMAEEKKLVVQFVDRKNRSTCRRWQSSRGTGIRCTL